MSFDSLYCVPLSPAEDDELRDRVRAQRADYVRDLLPRALDPACLSRLGGDASRVVAFARRLLPLAAREPATASRIIEHWSTAYLLRQVVHGDDQPTHLERVARLLGSASFLERAFESGGEPGDPTTGAIPEAVERVTPWDITVIDGPAALGLQPHRPASGEPTSDAPRIAESLTGAYALLDRLWPEVLRWAAVLVPAYIDLGPPPARDVHTSGSYGTGYPIYMTRVYDPFLHAEDVVHELQHCRFYLLDPAQLFGGWTDGQPCFVSPYRPDPRPLGGLVLGLHAFLAVNRLRLLAAARGLRAPEARALFRSHRANLYVFRTLVEHDRILPAGRALAAAMADELVAQDRAIGELAPPDFSSRHDEALAAHVASVQRAAGGGPLLNATAAYRDWAETVRLAARHARPAAGTEVARAH
jgi:hypothetical protein